MSKEREYELVVVLSPALDEEQEAGTMARVHKLINDRDGTLTTEERWGVQRLAYPLQDFREGNYHLTRFTMDVNRVREIEAGLRLTEEVLRHLLVKVES